MTLAVWTMIFGGAWLAYTITAQLRVSSQELGRFRAENPQVLGGANKFFDRVVALFAKRFGKNQDISVKARASKGERDMARKLADAGLDSIKDQGKFFLFRTVSYLVLPALGASSYFFIIPYYATLLTLFSAGVGVVLPMFWLKGKISGRSEEIQRELPLVLDLTNLGTSAGWDVASALERVIDSLYLEFPQHPLIRELKRARWLAASGYTWEESLKRVGNKLNNETVQRTAMALGQAIRQGGDRSKQLEGIAEDAQRVYYGELDKRLAALPVKALLATMMLMMAYFIILLAPAVVQIKNSVYTTIKARSQSVASEKGALSLIEAVLVMSLAVVLLVFVSTFGGTVESSKHSDHCLVQRDGNQLDLANSTFDPAAACTEEGGDYEAEDPGGGGDSEVPPA